MKRNDRATPNFVPPTAPTPVATPSPARPAPTADSVAAKWRDNLGAWIGVAVLLSAGYTLLRIGLANVGIVPLPDAEHSAWSFLVFTLIGGVAFGWLMAWRSSLDERERQGEINAMVERIEDDAEYIEHLEAKVTELKLAYANLEDDLAETRRSLHMAMGQASQSYRQPDEEVEPMAERNAKFLLNLAYRGDKWGRDHIVRTYDNWTPTMWTEARNLLELAGIVRTVGKATELLKPDYSTAVVALGAYCHNGQ